jgi:signal transduction histidine kinase
VRARLLAVLVALLAAALLIPGVALGRSVALGAQQEVFFDRSSDSVRFAALAQRAVTEADSAALTSDLRRYGELYASPAVVVDRDGQVTHGAADAGLTADPAVRRELESVLSGRTTEAPPFRWPWDRRPLVVAAPVMDGGDPVGAAVIVAPTDRVQADVLRTWAVLALGVLVGLLVAAALAVRLTSWVLRPVHRLDAAAHQLATGRLGARTPVGGGPPELRRLAAAFNEMADNVQALIEQQRTFVADASHQLRNPLNALLLRLDGLGLGLPESWREEFESARADGHHLTCLLDDLLALALAERQVATPEPVDAVALVHERVDAWAVAASPRRIRLVVDAPAAAVAHVDRAAFGGALDAVLDNAVKYSPSGGSVAVEVGGDGETVRVRVSDEGPGMTAEEMERAGDRFWRSPRVQHIEGSGLGLSIARALLERSGGALELASRPGRGLTATLSLSAAPAPAQVGGQALRRGQLFAVR